MMALIPFVYSTAALLVEEDDVDTPASGVSGSVVLIVVT